MEVGAIFAVGFVILTLPLGLLFGWLGKDVRWHGDERLREEGQYPMSSREEQSTTMSACAKNGRL